MRLRRNCKEVTRLVLAQGERPLSLVEQVVLRFHWLACTNCTRFREQARTMRQAVDQWRRYREE